MSDVKARIEAAAAEAAAQAALAEVSAGARSFGHGLLDALEGAVFGEKGGAEAAIARFEGSKPIVEAPSPAVRESATAKAARIQAKLAALKAAAAAPVEVPPLPKKTL